VTRDDEIGGAPMVRAALNAFYARVLADGTLSPFFLGVDIERHKKVQEEFFAKALGGAGRYQGRSLREAHDRARQRGANDDVFDYFIAMFARVLVDLKVPEKKMREWVAVLEGARGQILNR
jgi:hemoglobin